MASATARDRAFEVSQCLISSLTSVLFPSCAKASWHANTQIAPKAILFIGIYPGLSYDIAGARNCAHSVLTIYACCDYRDRLCRPYYWGLSGVHGTYRFLSG